MVVDVGVGWRPFTTLELQHALPECRVIGVEIDADRVDECRAFAPELEVRLGGFDLPLAPDERPGLVRALNLLRQYHPARADDALDRMARPLAVGGWLVDGRSDKAGDRLVARVHRRTAYGRQAVALVCHSTFADGFAPTQFQHLLPKDLGGPHHPVPAVAVLFEAWTAAVASARAEGARAPEETFRAAAQRIEAPVVVDEAGVREGYLAFWSLGVHRSIAPK
ncbi:MAG: hypothetical protein ACI8PZ_006092 [Myxococcota bacterium]